MRNPLPILLHVHASEPSFIAMEDHSTYFAELLVIVDTIAPYLTPLYGGATRSRGDTQVNAVHYVCGENVVQHLFPCTVLGGCGIRDALVHPLFYFWSS